MARGRHDDVLAHRCWDGSDRAPAQSRHTRAHARAARDLGGRQRGSDDDTVSLAATCAHLPRTQLRSERCPVPLGRGRWHGARLRPRSVALISAVGAVLLVFRAPGCGGAELQDATSEPGARLQRFVPAAYTPPLELGAQGIDPIAPETRTFTPGFRVQELCVDGGAPFAGRVPTALTAAAAPVSLPAGAGLRIAAQGTRQARSQISGADAAPGLPIGSHQRIAGARRSWLDRRAAMEQALAENVSQVENKSVAHDARKLFGAGSVTESTLSIDFGLILKRVGSVLGLIPRDNRRSHFFNDIEPDKRALHPGALCPFQTNPQWINAAFAAGTETWRGYGRNKGQEDGIPESTSLEYQAAIKNLVQNPIGGIKLPAGASRPWSWNTPATGGLTMTVFGMGFGYQSYRCTEPCLANPQEACTQADCLFIDSSIGETTSEATTWYSDSSLSLIVPAGIGADLSVNITTGRFKQVLILYSHFSYNAPTETRIAPGNSRLSGNVTLTVYGSNFGAHNPDITITLGETHCTSAIWQSDSQIICSKVAPGSGALWEAKVSVKDRRSETPTGLSRVFSYDKPKLTGVFPGNGPPSGYSVVTLLGTNFGEGPDSKRDFGRMPSCPTDAPGQSRYILKPREQREAVCGTGFNLPYTRRFIIPQTTKDGKAFEKLVWDNIRPHSLAHDPVGCILSEYFCTYQRIEKYCAQIPQSCVVLSNSSVAAQDAKYLAMDGMNGQSRARDMENKRWYAVADLEGGCEKLGADARCPSRILSSYIQDGVTCDKIDTEDPLNPQPYFHKHEIFSTAYLCDISPRPLGGCSTCAKLGCCNKRGSYGARVSGTECVTLRWMSDSSLACRLPPGIGSGHFLMVAINDMEGDSLDMKERLFSFDVPTVSSMARGASPTKGGKTYTMTGQDFGTFACNRTWCSFDESLLRCNASGCSLPGEPDSSTLVSHQVSLQSTYDMSTVFRTACAAVKWTSDTALSCTVAPGTGDMRVVELTVFRNYNDFAKDLESEAAKSLEYELPSMYKVKPTNIAANSGINVTIVGKDFGVWDTQPKARMGGTACIETFWVSESTIKCGAPRGLPPPPCKIDGAPTPDECKSIACNACSGGSRISCNRQYDTHPQVSGQGVCRSVVVTVDRLRGYLTEAFSYEAPQITGLNPTNGPPTGNFNVTMQGQSFGDNAQYEYSGQVGESSCSVMAWTSDTAISCTVIMGIAFGHVPRINIKWNSLMTRNLNVLFTFNSPVVGKIVPNRLPASGGIMLTVMGANYGAFAKFEFPDSTALPLPPKAKLGDTPCSLTQWYSDSAVTCTVLANGIGAGPGVGGMLPMEVKVGNQMGVYKDPFGYVAPSVKFASAVNGPALGGNVIMITGDNYGTYDYTPIASVGFTDCKLTRWQSNTAVSCTVARCTTYLAGGNLQLPVTVRVGLGHRITSTQAGSLEEYYNFDLQLTYARLKHDEKDWIKTTKKVPIDSAKPDGMDSEPSGAESESDDGFYDFSGGDAAPQKRKHGMEEDKAFERGKEAALQLHQGRLHNQALGKDIVTGKPMLYDQIDDSDAPGIGDLQAAIASVPTPIPAVGHSHHQQHKKEFEKERREKREAKHKHKHKEHPEAGALDSEREAGTDA